MHPAIEKSESVFCTVWGQLLGPKEEAGRLQEGTALLLYLLTTLVTTLRTLQLTKLCSVTHVRHEERELQLHFLGERDKLTLVLQMGQGRS